MEQNFNECLQYKEGFGKTLYHNMCNGENYDIAWGYLDWIVAALTSCFTTVLIISFVAFAISLLRDSLKDRSK